MSSLVRTVAPPVTIAALVLGLTPAPASAVPVDLTTGRATGATGVRSFDHRGWRDPARETLPEGDGWASVGSGTTGGSAAPASRVYRVRTPAQLKQAVAGNEPKIVQVVGRIDANTDQAGKRIRCEDYAVAPYTLQAYLDAYDPAHWQGEPTGPLEEARVASVARQGQQIQVNIGANTTLMGIGRAQLTGFSLNIAKVDNVIVRNLRSSDAYDCFPGWDGEEWNTEWDNVVVSGATHVWLNHLTLDDGETVDAEQPIHFGERLLRHDGLLDVVRQADLVTISWNEMTRHDKSLLWGNSDRAVADRGKLRVTMHHNELTDILQRAPRVRFGQAHVYNNVYKITDPSRYSYSWGVGVESSIVAQNNWFQLASGIPAYQIIRDWGGTGIDETGTWVNGRPVDVLAAYNAAHPDDPLLPTVAAAPGPHRTIYPTPIVPLMVARWAGAGKVGDS